MPDRSYTPPVQIAPGSEPVTRAELNVALSGLATREDVAALASDVHSAARDGATRGIDSRVRLDHLDACIDKLKADHGKSEVGNARVAERVAMLHRVSMAVLVAITVEIIMHALQLKGGG